MAPLTGDPAAPTDRPRVEDAVHSPEDIAARLRLPPPTQEQAEVVTAPLTPRLVLAGAGSGKTATMADRVVWLVANGLVRPDEVLGVTFTRKAAGELAERINGRVDALLRSGLEIPGFDGEPEDLGRASVSTYHSYAGALVRDHGLRIGVEPEARLLGGADAHRLMGAVVRSHPVVADTLGVAPSRLITQALRLAGDMAEHLVTADEVRGFLARLAEQGSALPLPPRAKTPSKEIQEFLTGLADRALMADLVARYDEVKREQDVMDFGDLLRHAARIAVEVPAAGEQERARFPVVLLDEFQDTSHAQMRIFAGLFGPRGPEDDAPGLGHCVTAVGDPHQSIYGFRGASAGQLFAFPHAFPRLETGPGGAPRRVNADVSHLTIAWRNEEAILAVANAVAAPLNAHAAAAGGAPVEVRTLRPRPGAGEGVVRVDRFVTAEEEAADVVARLGALTGAGPGGTTPSRAVLCRTRAQFGPVLDALDAAGLPYEVLGLSGLLALPEVAEVLAVLHVLADPTRSDQLVRLLTGPRWRIGVADLEVLQERARFVSRLRARRAAGGREDPAADAPDVAPVRDVSPEEDADAAAPRRPVPHPRPVRPRAGRARRRRPALRGARALRAAGAAGGRRGAGRPPRAGRPHAQRPARPPAHRPALAHRRGRPRGAPGARPVRLAAAGQAGRRWAGGPRRGRPGRGPGPGREPRGGRRRRRPAGGPRLPARGGDGLGRLPRPRLLTRGPGPTEGRQRRAAPALHAHRGGPGRPHRGGDP